LTEPTLIGRTLAHYRINAALGAGGMGEVYRATDTKLGRDIALKVLSSEMAHDPDRLARFQREARAVAALNHPNVVTLYSVEEADNVHFITMELLEGQPLDRLISADGLPADRIVEIAGAIAEALAAAHEKGIVHRDLKPANVMVTNEGRVKVLDFGLAKDVGAEMASDATLTSAGHTQAGVVMGTPAYMSPEQVSGRPLDHRSDIFSFGVVLHEMATGRRPFEGSSSAELISSILRDTPPSITDARPELPSDLARVIRRCLEKDPRYRMQTARDVSNEFRDLVRTTRPTPIPAAASRAVTTPASGQASSDEGFWVAVLPFKHGGSNGDLAALADGLTDDTITGLSKFSYLRVIARSSSSRYAGQSVDVRRAGKELNARYVIEGTLRQAGGRLRLAVQLVETVSGAHLWAENYERAFRAETIFELQDDLVPRIVSTVADMNGALPRSMSEGLRSKPAEQLSPYEAVLRSFGYFERVTPEELDAAIAAIESALTKVPTYGDALAMLALLSTQGYAQGFRPAADSLATGATAGRKAVVAAPANHLAWFSLSQALFFQKDFQSFRNAAERALALNAMDSNSLALHGEMLALSGEWERGVALSARARQLNPHHPGWYWHGDFNNAYRQHEYGAALEIAKKMNQTSNWGAWALTAAACGQLGDGDGAAKAVRELLRLRPDAIPRLRADCEKWFDAEHAAHVMEGFRKAGLHVSGESVPAAPSSSARTPAATLSSGARAAIREDEGFWVAVLPFKYTGSNADLKALAEGLSEEVITGLSRFSYLSVIARGSTAKYSSESGDIRAIGKELGARYVMEASLRQAGSKLRLAVQLVDAATGAHLWAENFERSFTPESVFELQDDLVPRIVSTIADMNGALPRSMSEGLRSKPAEQLSPYEAVLRSFAYPQRGTPEELTAARSGLEAALRKSPGYADAWAMLSFLSGQDYIHGYELHADAYESAAAAAQRAVELAPSNHLAYFSLAQSLWYQKDYDSFRDAAERAVALNPMDGNSVAYMGELLTYTGSMERGMQLAERAKQLNPNHPGWYWCTDFYTAFAAADYRKALVFAQKAKLQGFPLSAMFIATACGHLGDVDGGAKAVADLVRFRPELAAIMRKQVAKVWNAEYGERFLDGLRKAGLEIPEAGAEASQKTPSSRAVAVRDSGAARAAVRENEGFWVAVLPFKYTGDNRDLKALAEGLSEEVITGLSRFSYLRVIARGSTAKYSSESGDIRTIGKELGARYVMEGTLRQAGSKLRLAVQLADSVSGAHLWAETYERAFVPEAVFELQDELVPRIVSTAVDRHGVLPHSMGMVVREKGVEQLTPYEAVLLSFSYAERITPDEQIAAKACLERAVKQVPDYADAWAMLAMLFCDEYGLGFSRDLSLLERALDAARRAVKAGPSNHLAYQNLAYAHFLRREFGPCRSAAERSLAINSIDGSNVWFMGLVVAYMGDWERGCALVERAMQLNPNFPGKYRYPLVANAYRKGDYRGALDEVLRMNLPDVSYTPLLAAAAAGQLGEKEVAGKALHELLALRPDVGTIVRDDLPTWFQPELVAHFIEGLRKAGLEIPDEPAKITPQVLGTGKAKSGESRAAIREDEGFWVAVLPFKYAGDNRDLKALAEGLSEEVITGLSRFSYLRVIARGSTAKYSSESGDIRTIGKELGARYVMEGSLRQAGSKLRLAVQLVDAATGAHLWAETYERAFIPESVFELQDDLVPRIVSTVADQYGVLTRTMSDALRGKPAESLTPHEAVLRAFSFFIRVTPEEHAEVRGILEHAVEQAPDHADAWAMLAMMRNVEFADEFNAQPNPLDRAMAAAHRAVALAPTHALGHQALALVHFFRKEFIPFRAEVERAVALNPMDGSVLGLLGIVIHHAGEEEKGGAMVERAMQLNPNHPGVFRFVAFNRAYQERRYQEALEVVVRINLPGFFHYHSSLAAVHGQLGHHEAAQKAVQDLLALRPNFPAEARRHFLKWWNPEPTEHMIEGLRKAGLDIPDADAPSATISSTSTAVRTSSAASGSAAVREPIREEEGFWVAVLPFKYSGSNADLKALAEGLSEEVITGLARFSYLRVVARGSTANYSSESGDIRAIGKELGARYVMEASLRQAGSKLRLAVQLVDTVTGAHLWAETYERAFSPESLFELQDDLVPRIVATVADPFGVLPRSMSEVLRGKREDTLTPHESVLRAFRYFTRITPDEHAVVRDILERAVKEAPDHADSWAMLSMMYRGEFAQGFNPRPNSLDRALAAARRALELAPTHALGHYALATVCFFRKDKVQFRVEVERVLALNPNDAAAQGYLGFLLAASGEWERGCQMVESAMQLNPNCPGYFYFARCLNSYRLGKYDEALEGVARINMPGYFHVPAIQAAALGQLGRYDDARLALKDLLALRPNFAVEARQEYAKLYDDENVELILDGLRKAGLDIPDETSSSEAARTPSASIPAKTISTKTPSSGARAVREDEGFWVAVLPFKYMGSNADLHALADGLTDDIVAGMSRFSYLRVISRSSTARYAEKAVDVRVAAKELGARYVMEGSIRQAGAKIRIAAQLVDATSGASLWAETYDRAFTPDTMLDLLDDVVPRIVATVADTQGILPHSMTESLRNRDPESLTPYEALLRSFGFHQHVNAAEQLAGRIAIERAVKLAPDNADSWATLSWLVRAEYSHGFNPQPDAMDRSLAAARRAVDLAPSSQMPHAALASAFFFRRELDSFRTAAERAIPLNRMEGYINAFLGMLTAFSGDWERGCALVERSTQLNPNHPGWYWLPLALNAYRQNDGKRAREFALKVNMPALWTAQVTLAIVYAQLGELDRARAVVRDLRAARPEFCANIRAELSKWWLPDMVERMVVDLQKAGLEISGENDVKNS